MRALALALLAAVGMGCSEPGRPEGAEANQGRVDEVERTSAAAKAGIPPQVAVTGGVARGIAERRGAEPPLMQYHGIPYAAAPVGVLRWAPPAPVTPWQGARDATEPGPICPQRTHVGVAFYDPPPGTALPEQSEDCLTLNVWTAAARADEQRPTMVWIHGGGLQQGSGAAQSGRLLAEHGAVVVTFNYRLGQLGFFAHPELSAESVRPGNAGSDRIASAHPAGVSGNQGYRDQIQALQWVRDNIAQFGGDPGNVTIFGESAGAYSVSVLQASPLARGLFHRAIGQSGGAFHPMGRRLEDTTYALAAEQVGLRFAAALAGPDGDQSLAALRAIPAARVVEVAAANPLFSEFELLSTVDGDVLREDVGTAFAAGRQADVPVLVGSNADEGTALVAHFERFLGTGAAGFANFVQAKLPEAGVELATHYPANSDAEAMQSWAELFTDLTFTYPQRAWARSMAALSSPAWLYWFTWRPPVPDAATYGAFHGAFQMYLFNDLEAFNATPTAADRELANTLARTWVRFAKFGDPSGGDLAAWPAYTTENEAYMEFGQRIGIGHQLRVPQLAAIEQAWAARRAANAPPPASTVR